MSNNLLQARGGTGGSGSTTLTLSELKLHDMEVSIRSVRYGDGTVLDQSGSIYEGIYYYSSVESLVLTATPNANSYFQGWNGDIGDISDNVMIVTTDIPRYITATFLANPILQVTTVGNGTVEIYSDPSGTYISEGSYQYVVGTSVLLTAIPDGTSSIVWNGDIGDASSNAPSIYVTMDMDRTIQANFEIRLNLDISGNGTIDISGEVFSSGSY